jgi:uncharacterized protein
MSDPLPGRSSSVAEIATPQGERYLTQLCKHFQHRRPVVLEGASGHIAFDIGNCGLRAGGGALTLSLDAADDEQLARLQDVIARHLLRFAFREQVQINWRTTATTAPS